MNPIKVSIGHSSGLQAVRGFAALLVFLQHATWLATHFSDGPASSLNKLAFGANGVLLFFTLSGFLMAGQIGRPAKKFIFDRIRRIYPGFVIATFLSAVLLSYFGISVWPRLSTLLLVPVGVADVIHIPYWTLVYEMQFYFIVLLAGLLPRLIQIPLFIAWAIYIIHWDQVSPLDMMQAGYPNFIQISQSFYNLFFISGMLAALSIRFLRPTLVDGLLAGSLFVAVVYANVFVETAGRIYHVGMLIAAFFIIRYMSSVSPAGLLGKAMVRLGDVSYGVYLFHITTSLMTVLILKNTLGVQLGYWSGALCILLIGGSTSYLFGWGELKLQEQIKKMKLFASLKSPAKVTSTS